MISHLSVGSGYSLQIQTLLGRRLTSAVALPTGLKVRVCSRRMPPFPVSHRFLTATSAIVVLQSKYYRNAIDHVPRGAPCSLFCSLSISIWNRRGTHLRRASLFLLTEAGA